MKSILFVETPLHLIGALEAILYFKLKKYEIFVRYSGHKENDIQLERLIKLLCNEDEKQNITSHTIRGKNKSIIDYMKIIFYKYFFTVKQNEYQKIFIGDFSSGFLSSIIKNINREKIILIDDGAKTISIQNSFNDKNFYNLFTMYALKPIKTQHIYKNNFNRIKTYLSNSLTYDNKTIIFLGAKLSEEGIISLDYYLILMKEIAKRYSEYMILYIPHRSDSKEKIEEISKIQNIVIKHFRYPVEFYGLYEKSIPKKIFSFYSTALWSMSKMYSKVEVMAFKFDYSESVHRENINNIYEYYSKYIKIEELDFVNRYYNNELK